MVTSVFTGTFDAPNAFARKYDFMYLDHYFCYCYHYNYYRISHELGHRSAHEGEPAVCALCVVRCCLLYTSDAADE